MTQPDGPKAPLFRDKELRNYVLSWKAKSEKERRPIDRDPSLIDLVLSWSVEDILDEKLYADKVKIIPESFHSVEDYVESYIFPLLEEARAELCSSLEAVSDAPFAEITAIKKLKHDSKWYYFIDVCGWKSRSGFKIYQPSPGDIFILSTIIPKTAEDLVQKDKTSCLALVTDVKNLFMDEKESPSPASLVAAFGSDEEYHKGLIIEVSKGIKAAEVMGSSLHAIFISSLITSDRIWNALSFAIDLDNKNLNMIKEALYAKPLDKVTCNAYCFDQMVVWATKFYKELIFLKLNESQKDAVLISLSNIKFHHSYSFNLIWSPPGTGKAKTTSVLLWVLLDMGSRTLTCAPTNIAVAKLCSCLLSIVKDYRGSDNKSTFPSFSLGDIVLLANEDEKLMGEDFQLQEIILEHRVEKLAECFSPASGWKQILLSLISLLDNCVPMYYSSLEDQETVADMGLKEFLRKKLDAVIQPLCDCMRLLSMHLTSAYISERVVGNMVTLSCLLEDFRSLLCTENVSDNELEELFSPEGPVGGYLLHTSPSPDSCSAFENTTIMFLDKTRRECLHVLRVLKDSLHLPLNISKDWIREFCLKNATLIFCNASTASSLQYYKMEPFELLVIYEASQLKECEAVIPLCVKGIQHAILIGDERQLPSTVKIKVSNAAGFGRSLFERLVLLGHEKHLLDIQSCMHPLISTFPNAKFYDGLLLQGPNVRHATYERHYLQGPMYGPYSFINIAEGREEQDEISNSWKNMVEVAVVMKIIRSLFKSWNGKAESLSVGIMCSYSAQVNAIQTRIANQYKKQNGFTLKAKSIDGFQECEMDIIILSTVRCNNNGKIGLLRNLNLTNVALTRARHSLWILGNASTLIHSDSVWEELISDTKKRGLFFNADEDEGLAKSILQVKNEYNQLEDLLKPDSVLLSKAQWRVSFSNYFLKSFAMLEYFQTKQLVIRLLMKLAEGWRPKSESLHFPDSCHLVKQCRVSELYLIWTVDIVLDENYIQVLKVWDIVPGTEIPRLVKQLDNIFAMYTDVYIEHCKQRCIEGKLHVPMVWHAGKVINCYKEQRKSEHVENLKVSESLLLMKFYSQSSGVVNHLLSDSEGKEIDLPFELSDQEKEIVCFPRSAFILGRSGTGKTTVLTMKLIQREQHHHISWNGLYDGKVGFSTPVSEKNELGDDLELNENVLRQVFITVSPKLCAAIRNQIYRLQSFSSRQGSYVGPSSTDMYDIGDSLTEFMDIPNTFIGIPTRHYPLVITLKKFLMMLDGTVSKSYFRNLHSTRKFLTDKGGVSNSVALQAFIQSKEVTYERFAVSYWPHFKAELKKKFDPLTVFTQIISHIKGGTEVNDTMEGKLGREKYIMLSEYRVSTFSSEQREQIYEIFLDYEKRKAKNGEFDICDMVNYLHRQLRAEGFVGDNMDFIYIDEVQDLTVRQIALFKYVCKNFQEGFVFAGDTAQTIARGIDFRFEDIKSLFYREFLSQLQIQRKVGMKQKDVPLSDIIHLKQNFRTHAGVLKLAQSIVDLLIHFFPLSVDVLSPESSLIYGEAPVIIESGNDENDITAIFGSSGSTNAVVNWGFGAEQVILVRDDSNKKKILDIVGRKSLVLTILESKGLEFQNVLMYNFFGPSPLGRHWNVVYEYMNKKNLLDSAFTHFDAAKHCILGSELKQLYVAITRTRQRLWIWESDYELSKPVFDYWKKLDLVQVRWLDSSLAHAMRAESSAEDWKSQGIKLFNDGNFEMATMCFEHADDEFREKWAKAAAYRSTGERTLYTNFEQAQGALQQAAKIYESIGKPEAAASCFIMLNDYKRAGKIYLESSCLKEAGDCFDMARCWVLAANAYAKGKYLSKCLSICTKRRLFGLGLHFIEQWKEDPSLDVVNKRAEVDCLRTEFLESCARSYLELGVVHRRLFVGAFNSMDLIRNFLKTRNLIDILFEAEMDSGNYLEAAAIARTRGNLLREADALAKFGHFRKASKLVILHVVINSLWADGNKGWPLKQFRQKAVLLMKAKSLAEKVSNDFYQSICAEVIILSDTDTTLSNLLLRCNDAQRFQNVRLEIFAARKLLDVHLNLDPSKFHRGSETDQDLSNHTNKMVSCNCTIVETLIYSWDLWKERILNVLSYLQLLGKTKLNECSLYADFCMEYFGVRREFNKDTFTVLNSKAYWYEVTNVDSLQYQNMVQMNVPQFASCAKNFLASELLSVGISLLNRLDFLHKFHTNELQPLSCHGQVLIHMFDVARFLKESQYLYGKHPDFIKVKRFLALVKSCFPNIIFPLEFGKGLMESMVALRENDISRDILKEILEENLNPKAVHLTNGQIGWIMMLLFVSGRLTDNLYQKIKICLNQMLPWKAFIEHLKAYLDTGFGRNLVVYKFQDALASAFVDDWRRSYYMSPHCFMYLFECLTFLASSCLQRGSFYTTKSTFFEMATCDVWKSFLGVCLADPDADKKSSDTLIANGKEKVCFTIKPVLTPELHQDSAEELAKEEESEGKPSEDKEMDALSPMQRKSKEEEIADPDVGGKSSDTMITKGQERVCLTIKPEFTPELHQEITGELAEVLEGESSGDRQSDAQASMQQQSQQEVGQFFAKDEATTTNFLLQRRAHIQDAPLTKSLPLQTQFYSRGNDPEMASQELEIEREFQFNMEKVLQFLARTAEELLITKEITKMWVETMSLSTTTVYYPLLLSRLVVAISLVHLNSGWDLSRIAELLCSSEILSDLPKEFSDRLQKVKPDAMRNRSQFLRVVAEALDAVGNPLMVAREVQNRGSSKTDSVSR